MRDLGDKFREHIKQAVTTTCRTIKFKLLDGREFGITTLDRGLTIKGLHYSALNGFNCSVIATDTGLSVDNAEATALLSANVEGITADMVLRGELDGATWEMRLVNWADLTSDSLILDSGDIGEVLVKDDAVYMPELLSYAMRLRQSIGQVWSRRCRAEFGTPAASQTGCGVNASAMWRDGVVTNVDPDDPYRVFAGSGLIALAEDFSFARVEWLTGDNASLYLKQVEAWGAASGTVALFEPLMFPVRVGDTFRIRRDCNKAPASCIAYGNYDNYKGEPSIPTGDGLETMTPSAQVFGGLSGSAIVE